MTIRGHFTPSIIYAIRCCLYCQKPRGLTIFFIIADTIHDLLIMHACDTFCDELILLHMLFQSAVITLLLISLGISQFS